MLTVKSYFEGSSRIPRHILFFDSIGCLGDRLLGRLGLAQSPEQCLEVGATRMISYSEDPQSRLQDKVD